jgi:SAM-dependent methyltransferase
MTYLLDNASHHTAVRFTALSAMYDDRSYDAIAAVTPKHGTVWEAGAGNGSVALRLAQHGRNVLASDVDPRWLPQDTVGLRIMQHDLTSDRVPGVFDTVHARLVLMHLPDPDAALRRLVQALRPGGWLVVEELDPLLPYAPLERNGKEVLVNRVGRAFTAALDAAGASNTRGITAHKYLTGAGLEDVHTEGHVHVATPDSPAHALMAANVQQTRPQLVNTGLVDDDDLDDYLGVLRDPDVTWCMPIMFTACGRKPTPYRWGK